MVLYNYFYKRCKAPITNHLFSLLSSFSELATILHDWYGIRSEIALLFLYLLMSCGPYRQATGKGNKNCPISMFI